VAGIYMFDNLYNWVISKMPYAELDAMLNKYTGEAKESPYYKTLTKYRTMLKAVQPGSVAPDFTLLKRDSSKFTLSENRGKYLMIDMWASWCHPCRQAIPHWKSVYQKYHDKGFDIVSMSLDSRMKDWTKAMDEEKMPWTQIKDEFPKRMPGKVSSLYMTSFIPFYVLLDKEGKILVYSGDEAKIDEKLKEIYGN
jgi:thiol-disulfide isomerase/thioredoxin